MDSQELIKSIKTSKKYREISEEIIKTKVEDFLKKYPYADEELALKEIKASLHKTHGSFRFSAKLKKKHIETGNFLELLKSNRSTKERLEIYPELYSELFKITGKPKSIVDLGCGLNPLSFSYMNLQKSVKYLVYDINDSDKDITNNFFEKEGINGKAEILDLSKIENIKTLPNADVCFMFKLLDVLEKKGHKYSEEIITELIKKYNFIVVSFSKLTVSGRPMNFPYRGWIERMLDRLNIRYTKLDFPNEFFYVISK
jgi:16S rRNA (guanine(1405)-N(7))-methyltransferase